MKRRTFISWLAGATLAAAVNIGLVGRSEPKLQTPAPREDANFLEVAIKDLERVRRKIQVAIKEQPYMQVVEGGKAEGIPATMRMYMMEGPRIDITDPVLFRGMYQMAVAMLSLDVSMVFNNDVRMALFDRSSSSASFFEYRIPVNYTRMIGGHDFCERYRYGGEEILDAYPLRYDGKSLMSEYWLNQGPTLIEPMVPVNTTNGGMAMQVNPYWKQASMEIAFRFTDQPALRRLTTSGEVDELQIHIKQVNENDEVDAEGCYIRHVITIKRAYALGSGAFYMIDFPRPRSNFGITPIET